jgi:hypothetical protein
MFDANLENVAATSTVAALSAFLARLEDAVWDRSLEALQELPIGCYPALT